MQQSNSGEKVSLPNASGVLVLGIGSILLSVFYGLPGLLCALISLLLSAKPRKAYRSQPERYTGASRNSLKAGRVCAIIGLILSLIVTALFAFMIFVLGASFDFWRILENG